MKREFRAMAMAAALLVAAAAGNALASEYASNSADPENAPSQTWVSQGAMETGALPDARGGDSAGDRITADASEVPTVEAGGVRFRLGIDTGA